ncbi:hypothetical protein [Pseudomonas nitroreducens]|uniref:hypothetical protein n=1 Tax=Pseudomonas nitroreducens TaxID=46680 RepID=UPI003826FB74
MLFAFLEHFPLLGVVTMVAVLMMLVLFMAAADCRPGGGHAGPLASFAFNAVATYLLVGEHRRARLGVATGQRAEGTADGGHRHYAAVFDHPAGIDLGFAPRAAS